VDPTPQLSPVELLERNQAQIRRLVRRLVAPQDALDVEQELHVAALERPPRALVALPAWIATTVRNLAAKRLRSRTRREARERAAAPFESLPSTAELAAQVELVEFLLRCVRELPEPEQVVVLHRYFEERSTSEIARRLGLGESTVRARLSRALVRLRERLDGRSGGERDRWVRALAPWAVKGAGAGAALGIGVSVMTLQGAALALAIVAAVGVATVAIVRGSPPRQELASTRRDPDEPRRDDAPLPSVVRADAPTREPESPAHEREAPTDGSSLAALLDPEADRLPAIGRVKLRVVDARTGAELSGCDVRFLCASRFAAMEKASVVDVALTSGTWSLSVSADGYEPELREGVVVAADEQNDLGVIALARGTGVIEGRIRSDGVDAALPRFVELRGAGRSPCELCGREPTCCGYAWDRSLLRVGGDGRFFFRGLAAGSYFVRPLDDRPRLEPTTRIELARGEVRFVELTLAAPVVLTFELLDEQGAPFVGVWANDYEETPEKIHVDLDVDGVATGFDAGPDPAELRDRIGPPRFLGQSPPFDEVTEATSIGIGSPFRLPGLRADRARGPDDSLAARADVPFFAALELACGRTAPNAYFVHDLPASRVRMKARCGALSTEELLLDLSDPDQHHARLVFRRAKE